MCFSKSSAKVRDGSRSKGQHVGPNTSRVERMSNETERGHKMRSFLERAGWGGALVTPLVGDASTRRYFRVATDGRRAMLMDQPQNAETPACPPDATPAQRQALGYNAIARLAGADCGRFIAAAD